MQGHLAAVTGESGRVELYGAEAGRLLHWRQEEAGKRPVPGEGTDAGVEPGTSCAPATSAERTTAFFTDAGGALCAGGRGRSPWRCSRRPGRGPCVPCAV